MPFISKATDEAEYDQYHLGYPKGLNNVQDKSLVNDKNLTIALNVLLSVDGVKRRPGTTQRFDEGGASYVYGGGAYYKRNGNVRKFLRIANAKLQYLNGAVWSDIGVTAFANLNACFIQARDKMFIHNGSNNMRYTDGSTITEYTAIITPVGLTVTPTGSAGTTPYSYRVEAFNGTGKTAACARVQIANGNAVLSATNYNKLDWTAVVGASGYNVFGRTATGLTEVFLATVYTNTYNDIGGTLTPATLPQEYNNTGGIKAKAGIYTMGRQFVFGVTEATTYYPTRLYYSGVLDYVDSFVGGDFGGGWVEVYANDGGEIVDVKPYQDGVLVWKTNGLFKFYFTSTGLPALKEVTRGHGGLAFGGSQAVDNDYIYAAQKDGKLKLMTVGQQQNYVGDQLRTNDIGIFISEDTKNFNWSRSGNVRTWLFNDTFGFTYTSTGNTENDRGFVIDTRFGAWVKWDGDPMKSNGYIPYDDGTSVKLYSLSNHNGSVYEMFTNDTNDTNQPYNSVIGTKFYNAGKFDIDKIFRNPSLWFKYIRGGTPLKVEIWVDGVSKRGEVTVVTASYGLGVGSDLAGSFMAGTTLCSSTATNEAADIPVELSTLQMARSMGFVMIDSSINTQWLLMGDHIRYSLLDGKPPQTGLRVEVI
jgi:hypothetical protein